jgi:hypothetical protein
LRVGNNFLERLRFCCSLSSSAADTPIRACRYFLGQRNVTYSVSVKRNVGAAQSKATV